MSFDTESKWGKWKPVGIQRCALGLIAKLPVNAFFHRLAFLLRKPVKKGRKEIYDVVIWGLKLRLSCRGNLTEQRWLTMPNFHDHRGRDFIVRLLASGGVFVDVGANAGFYSFWALSHGFDKVSVVAVEPNPRMCQRIRFNVETNDLGRRFQLFPYAVTSEPSEVVLEEQGSNLGETRVSGHGEGIRVPGRPLFDIMKEAAVGRPDLLKIDIEGGEASVLRAFFDQADRSLWPRFVIGETIGEQNEALRSVLYGQGYIALAETKMNGIFRLSDD